VDLNRNFPADNRTEVALHGSGPLSEPESRALMRAIERFAPARVLSIHQPLRCVDYDGPGEALAKSISAAIDGRLPVQKLGGRPGSLGSYLGETRGVPIVTLELPAGVESNEDALWRDYGAALGAFLRGAPCGSGSRKGAKAQRKGFYAHLSRV
jgi:protein MpaA